LERAVRKAAARRLAEAGCTTKQIASVTGHTTLKEVERYRASYEEYFAAKKARREQGRVEASAIDVPRPRKPHPLGQVEAGAVSKVENPVPTPSLDPRNITAIEGYEEHAEHLGMALRAFEVTHKAITDMFTAREAAASNPEWTPATQTIKTAEYAAKAQERATKAMDSAHSNLCKAIKSYEAELSRPLETANQTVTAVALAGEIRAHVKSMDHTERQKFMREAFNGKDVRTLQAVLSGPSYLSGMDMAMHDVYVRQYQEMQQPDLVSRVAAMKKAKEMLERGGGARCAISGPDYARGPCRY